MKKVSWCYIAVFLLINVVEMNSFQDKEYVYKAVFIERFTRFIEWPNDAFINSENTFAIAVIGENLIAQELKKIAGFHSIKNKRTEIRTVSSYNLAVKANIIFVTADKYDELEKIINSTKNKPVLIISESPGAAEEGAHINFFVENNKLRFEINERAVYESGLNVSYLLLKSAKIIDPRK